MWSIEEAILREAPSGRGNLVSLKHSVRNRFRSSARWTPSIDKKEKEAVRRPDTVEEKDGKLEISKDERERLSLAGFMNPTVKERNEGIRHGSRRFLTRGTVREKIMENEKAKRRARWKSHAPRLPPSPAYGERKRTNRRKGGQLKTVTPKGPAMKKKTRAAEGRGGTEFRQRSLLPLGMEDDCRWA